MVMGLGEEEQRKRTGELLEPERVPIEGKPG